MTFRHLTRGVKSIGKTQYLLIRSVAGTAQRRPSAAPCAPGSMSGPAVGNRDGRGRHDVGRRSDSA
jgi:hypothetical protein